MDTLLKHFTLIDGTGRKPVADAVIAIRDGKISSAGPASTWEGEAGGESITLDLNGAYILPGLIDTHVHLSGSGEADSQFYALTGQMALKILSNAQKNLAAGITTARDLGGWSELEFDVRRSIQRGDFAGPRLCLAGRFISITEAGAEYYAGMYRVADGVDEVRKAVREQVKHGADVIKMGVTGAVLVESGAPGVTHFNEDEIQALVDEAKKFGKPVAMHAHGIDGIRKAVEAGVTTLEHGTYLHRDPGVIRLMAQRGVFLVPTLKAGWDIILAEKSNIPDWIMRKNVDSQGDAAKSLKAAHETGARVAMGSDVGTPLNYHGENALEIYWMEQAGLSKMEALVAATGNAAKALGWDSWLGTLEAGKVADLIAHEKNPLEDLRALADKESLRLVMKDGEVAASHAGSVLPNEVLAKQVLTIR